MIRVLSAMRIARLLVVTFARPELGTHQSRDPRHLADMNVDDKFSYKRQSRRYKMAPPWKGDG